MIPKKYTNELLKTLMEMGYDINSFSLRPHPHAILEMYYTIVYKNTPMQFWLIPADRTSFEPFRLIYTKFSPTFYSHENNTNFYSLDELKQHFKAWLNTELKSFIENEMEIDYWKIIKESPLTVEGIDFSKNESFTQEEQGLLKLGLDEIKMLLSKNFGLNATQIEQVNKKIDYLIDATKRLNKIDWKTIAVGFMMQIAYDMAFDEHKRGIFFGLFLKLWAVVQHLPLHI